MVQTRLSAMKTTIEHSSSTPFMEIDCGGRRLTLTVKADIASVDRLRGMLSGLPADSSMLVDLTSLEFLDRPTMGALGRVREPAVRRGGPSCWSSR
jgi:hypothetical protein